jgi:hypothetical protein
VYPDRIHVAKVRGALKSACLNARHSYDQPVKISDNSKAAWAFVLISNSFLFHFLGALQFFQ